MKFKKISIITLVYFIIISEYISFISKEAISEGFFYSNIIFIIIFLLIGNLFIEKNKLIEIELYRYENKIKYFKKYLVYYTLNIGIVLGVTFIINCLLLYLKGCNINFMLEIYLCINLFIILEIMYICIKSFALKKRMSLLRYLTLIFLISMFVFAQYGVGVTPVNIFKYMTYIGSFYEIIIHYIIWGYAIYLLFDHNNKRVEL